MSLKLHTRYKIKESGSWTWFDDKPRSWEWFFEPTGYNGGGGYSGFLYSRWNTSYADMFTEIANYSAAQSQDIESAAFAYLLIAEASR